MTVQVTDIWMYK